MAAISQKTLTSAELGVLWMSYLAESCLEKIIGNFAKQTQDNKAKRILENFNKGNRKKIDEMKEIFKSEKAVTPIAFGDHDVFIDAPVLFDDAFHIMLLRTMSKIIMGFSSVHYGMVYRKDVLTFFEGSIKTFEDSYELCTSYLIEQGVLARPPYVTMPKEVEFIEEKKYMSGVQIFGKKRALNSLELAYLFQTIEVNVFGMQLMTGFAQVAKETEAKDYFVKGKELAKKIVGTISSVLLESDIQPPTTWAGKATDSIVPHFSDKLMMYCTNIMASSALGTNALGMSFSMRSDLPLKLAIISKDTLNFARAGGKLMIKHKWLEEPPQMEDRNQIIKGKKSLLPV